jgi:hypothetical protein
MTFWVLTEDTEQLISRSVIRSAEEPGSENKRLSDQWVLDQEPIKRVFGMSDLTGNPLPSIDPDQIIGHTFISEHAGMKQKAEVKEMEANGDYLIEYADGNEDHMTYAEIINLLNKSDEDGHELWTFSKILNHRERTNGGKKTMEVEVLWDMGEQTWEPLNNMKADDPVTVAQYVKEKDLVNKPYWKWANRYLKNPKKFIRYSRQVYLAKKRNGPVYKFGVRVPRNLKEAILIDQQSKDNAWKEAIKKEMDKIMEYETFRMPPDGKPPPDYKKIPCHMIFDVKHDGRRKARFVAGGHLTMDPGEEAYLGVVTPEAVRLGMFAAIHNNLKVMAADIGNAYLHAKTNEKLYTILSEEYGLLAGKVLIIDKGLYGLRSSGARFHEHLSGMLRKLGFKPSKADSLSG